LVAAALVAAALVAAAPPAQVAAPRWNPRAPENTQLLPGFSYATVEPLLNAIGARHQRSGTSANKPAILATLPNGRKAALVLSSCDGAGLCKALSIQSYWTRIAKSPPADTAAAIEKFNHRYAFAKAFVAADGRPALQRYLTADYGFIRGDLAVNLLVFASQAETFATEVLAPLETPRP
jgi:hypothetical protein